MNFELRTWNYCTPNLIPYTSTSMLTYTSTSTSVLLMNIALLMLSYFYYIRLIRIFEYSSTWYEYYYVVVVSIVVYRPVIVVTFTHRYDAVRGHKTGSNNSDSVAQLIQRSTSHARIVCSMARTLWRIVARFSALV